MKDKTLLTHEEWEEINQVLEEDIGQESHATISSSFPLMEKYLRGGRSGKIIYEPLSKDVALALAREAVTKCVLRKRNIENDEFDQPNEQLFPFNWENHVVAPLAEWETTLDPAMKNREMIIFIAHYLAKEIFPLWESSCARPRERDTVAISTNTNGVTVQYVHAPMTPEEVASWADATRKPEGWKEGVISDEYETEVEKDDSPPQITPLYIVTKRTKVLLERRVRAFAEKRERERTAKMQRLRKQLETELLQRGFLNPTDEVLLNEKEFLISEVRIEEYRGPALVATVQRNHLLPLDDADDAEMPNIPIPEEAICDEEEMEVLAAWDAAWRQRR